MCSKKYLILIDITVMLTINISNTDYTLQDRQCMYNVTLGCVYAGIVAVGKQYYILCVCVYL